jgi:hypothetical protein
LNAASVNWRTSSVAVTRFSTLPVRTGGPANLPAEWCNARRTIL